MFPWGNRRGVDVARESKASLKGRGRQRERQVLKAGGLAELAAEIAGVGYWSYDLVSGQILWSDLIYAIMDRSPDNPPRNVEDVLAHYHPDDRGTLADLIGQAIATGESYTLDCRVVASDGEERAVVGKGVCTRGPDGAVTGLYGTLMDVTEQRRADAEVRRNEALYRLLAENATDIIGRISLEGETLYVTPSAAQILGYSDEQMVGGKTLEHVHRDDGATLVAGYRRVMAGGDPERIEYRFQRGDGQWIWLEASPTLVRDERGHPKEFIDVARDITARKAMEAELVAARHAAEAAAEAKSRFLANMSHELRTPITAVLGFTELLASRCPLDEEAQRYVERIASGGRALLATVNDVLDFSKLEAGQVRIAAEAVAPRALVRETLELFEAQAAARDLTLTFAETSDLPPWAVGDPDRLRQVLLNLIGNAVKFTETGGVAVEAAWDPGSETATFRVIDTGPGIGPERRGELFQRFSQVDGATTRRQHGTGLGLAICKGLVEAMGGAIGVEPADADEGAAGSCFWFSVPMPKAEGPARDECAQTPMTLAATRVLLADDNAVNRELVRTILAPFDVALVEATDGYEAMAAARDEDFDVILMDIRMPGCDGRRAAAEIRRQPGPNRETPIIAFSADGEHDLHGKDATLFAGRLSKPLKPADLLRVLSENSGETPKSDDKGRRTA